MTLYLLDQLHLKIPAPRAGLSGGSCSRSPGRRAGHLGSPAWSVSGLQALGTGCTSGLLRVFLQAARGRRNSPGAGCRRRFAPSSFRLSTSVTWFARPSLKLRREGFRQHRSAAASGYPSTAAAWAIGAISADRHGQFTHSEGPHRRHRLRIAADPELRAGGDSKLADAGPLPIERQADTNSRPRSGPACGCGTATQRQRQIATCQGAGVPRTRAWHQPMAFKHAPWHQCFTTLGPKVNDASSLGRTAVHNHHLEHATRIAGKARKSPGTWHGQGPRGDGSKQVTPSSNDCGIGFYNSPTRRSAIAAAARAVAGVWRE